MGRPISRFGRVASTAALGITIGLFADGVDLRQSLSVPSVDDRTQQASMPAPPTQGAAQASDLSGPAIADVPALVPSGLESLEQKFESIAQRVAPSVVAISVAIDAVADSDDLLRAEELNPQKLQSVLDRTTRVVGTGFIIDPEGYILTNEHVIGEAEQLWITTDDHRVLPAIVVGSDPRGDLAVLKVPARNLPAVRFADYGSVARGQWAIALGNPYGLAGDGEMCMSVGIVSATDRSLPKLSSKENRLYSNLIQTTAQINPGNSGGPLFDLNGNVIGVNTAVILPQKSTNGIGFAVPITANLMSQVTQLKEGREIVYGYLGVTVSTPTDRMRQSLGLDGVGARVDSIESGSPADASPLRVDDIVVEVNGELIRDGDHFVRLVGMTPVERPARMGLYRDGRAMTVEVALRKRQLPAVAVTRESQRLRWRGMLLGPIPQHWTIAEMPRPESGLMVLAVGDDSPMLSRGVRPGSILSAVAGERLNSIADLQRVINDLDPEQWTVELSDTQPTVVSISE